MLKSKSDVETVTKAVSSVVISTGLGTTDKSAILHNNLSGLYGGSAGDMYHLTSKNHSDVSSMITKVFHGEEETLRLVEPLTDDMKIHPMTLPLIGSRPPTPIIVANDGSTPDSGACGSFNGTTSSATLPDYAALDSVDMSLSFWIKPYSENSNSQYIMCRQDYIEIRKEWSDLIINVGNTWDIWISGIFVTGATNHIAVTVDGSRVRVYVDGVLKKNQNVWGLSLGASSNDLVIGAYDSSTDFLYGDIDEIQWYNITLDSSEITELYNGGNGLCEVPSTVNEATELVAQFSDNAINQATLGAGEDLFMDYVTLGDPLIVCAGGGTTASRGVAGLSFAAGEVNEIFFPAQLTHEYIEGTDIDPHCHWAAPIDVPGNVVWGLEYIWRNYRDDIGNTLIQETVLTPEVFAKQDITSIGEIDGTGKKISSILSCRLYRKGDDPLDTYPHHVILQDFDFHVYKDTLGSRQPWVK